MTSRQYHAIDEEVAAVIKRLHKRYPKLGPDGLWVRYGSKEFTSIRRNSKPS